MRLNALHPSDNPMEELFFCFGGGDDSGDSGGGSSHPGRPGGESGERGDRSDRGDGGDRDERNPGNIGVGSGASLGATSNQNFSSGAGRTADNGDNRSFAVPDFAPNISGQITSIDPEAIQDVQDRLTVRSATDITSGLQTGTEDRDTRINPMDPFAGESLMTPDERALSNSELLSGIGRTSDLGPSISSTPSIAPSPYEQLMGAPEFQTSMGAPPGSTEFGQFDIPFSSIDVLGVEVPTSLGIVEGVLNTLFDPTGTTQQAVYDKGVRSINGQPTGNESGLEVVTADGRTAAYDPERNIVFDSDPLRGVRPFSKEGVPEEIQALYDKKRAVDKQEREREGEGDGIDRGPRPTDIQEEDVALDNDTEYEGQPIGGLFPTSTLPDLNRDLTQYTDVGNIQPFVLRPYGMKKGGIVDAAKFKNGGMVQRYQDGGSVDAATQRLADLTYQMMTSGIIKDQGLDPEIKTPRFSSAKERNEFLREAGYNPGDLQNFYGSNAGPQNEISKALYERYTGSDRPAGRSNIADLAYLQSQGFDVSKNMDMYDPKTRQVFNMAVQNPRSGYDLSRQYATTGEVPTQVTGIEALQNQFNQLQQRYDDLLARFEDEQRQQSLMTGMGSGTFGESSAGYTGTGINAGAGSGTFAQTTPTYTQLDPLAGLGSGFMGNTQPSFLMPQTPETNFLADPFSTATNVGYVPPPVYYPFAYQVPGQQQ